MKLSAPPPPPPEPEPNPDANPNPPPAATAEPASEAAPPAPKPDTRPATWPTWFGGVDAALVVLAAALGFLAASFAARNSDLFIHLGAGKMLATGQYSLGTDPLSYSAADRPWANTSWLFDLGSYLLYSGDGFVLVLVKALAVAAAVALLIGIRRPGYPLWPWAVLAALAVLASSRGLTLGPGIGSILLLAATLFVLFRVPSRPGSWRVPAILGVLFWVWAGVDAWFFVGPAAVALLLIGELIQKYALNRTDDPTATEPIGRLDIPTLARCLVIGVIACTLTPHHVRVWQLPVELVGSDDIARDPRMKLVLTLSPLSSEYTNRADLGKNLNGLAYAILLAGGGLILGFGVGRLRASHLALWIGFAALSLATVPAIPLFALVAVPLVAAQLNALAGRVTLGTKTERRTRLILLGSGGGRVLCLLALLVGCAAAWPGWLHPQLPNPAEARRVVWAVEPNPALVRAATQLEQWRESKGLPDDARGLTLSVELANYCAYYAPHEKVFLNSRFGHHRPELKEFIDARAALGLIQREEPPSLREVAQVLARHDASYLAFYDSQRIRGPAVSQGLWLATDSWSPWYLDGYTVVCGWRNPAAAGPAFDRLRLDPTSLAFGPDVAKLPAGKVAAVPMTRELFDEFARPVKFAPPEAAEAVGWLEYKASLEQAARVRQDIGLRLLVNTPLPRVAGAHEIAVRFSTGTGLIQPTGRAADGSPRTLPVLALRAARRAIATNPDHPDGYFALAQAIADPDLPIQDGERTLGMVTAYRQCLSRLPAPENFRRNVYAASPTDVAMRLTFLYLNMGQDGRPQGLMIDAAPFPEFVHTMTTPQGRTAAPPLAPVDLARQLITLGIAYAEKELADPDPAAREKALDPIRKLKKHVDDLMRVRNDQYQRDRDRATQVQQRFMLARRHGLIGEAIQLIKGMKAEDLSKEFGAATPVAILQVVALEMAIGRIEDAAEDLDEMKALLDRMAAESKPDPTVPAMRMVVRLLEYQKLLILGDYAAAAGELESQQRGDIGTDKLLADIVADRIDPGADKDFEKIAIRMAPVGVAWPMFPMLTGPPMEAASHLSLASSYTLGLEILRKFDKLATAKISLGRKVQADAQFFFRLGVLAMFRGDIPAARSRFEQAVSRPAPPGWGLEPFKPTLAVEYLRLIDEAEKKAKRP